jgi:hypothetical protein
MNRSVHRSLYCRHLSDAAYELSVSNEWRPRIVEACGRRVLLDADTAHGLYEPLVGAMRRWGLVFTARVVPVSSFADARDVTGSILFEVASREFPAVRQWSANNPAALLEDEEASWELAGTLPEELWDRRRYNAYIENVLAEVRAVLKRPYR